MRKALPRYSFHPTPKKPSTLNDSADFTLRRAFASLGTSGKNDVARYQQHTVDPVPRRWFRFSLRTFFVLVALAACAAWWVQAQLQWIRQREAFLAKERYLEPIDPTGTPELAPWRIRIFGARGYEAISFNANREDVKQLKARAKELFPEAEVVEYVGGGNYFSF